MQDSYKKQSNIEDGYVRPAILLLDTVDTGRLFSHTCMLAGARQHLHILGSSKLEDLYSQINVDSGEASQKRSRLL